jgi:polar amino acid transport system permease protein
LANDLIDTAGALVSAPQRLPPRKVLRIGRARILDVLVILGTIVTLAAMVIRANAVLDYRWDWSVIPVYLVRTDPATGGWAPNLLLLGFFTTIRLAVWSLVLGTVLGTVVAAMRLSRRTALRWLARIFVELVRNTPPIVLIFVLYFFVSSQVMPALGIDRWLRAASRPVQDVVGVLLARPDRINDLLSGLACLGLLAGAYITEIIRAGLQSVPTSQIEAGRALGLRGWPIFRMIVLPPALRNVLPALAGQFIISIKDSSLVSLISVQELTFMASEVSNSSGRFFEVWLFTAALYFCVCFSCSVLFRVVERHWKLRA